MPVDEFGREIPAEARRRRSGSPRSGGSGGGYGGPPPPSNYQPYQPSAPSYYHAGPYHPSMASRAEEQQQQQPQQQQQQQLAPPPPPPPSIQTSSLPPPSSSSGPPSYTPSHRSPHHYGRGGYGGPRGGGGGGNFYRGGRSPANHYGRRGGGGGAGPYGPSSSYSSSPKPSFFNANNSGNSGNLGHRQVGGAGGGPINSNTTPTANTPHPSTKYLSAPMLCGYLWKQENQEKKKAEAASTDGNEEPKPESNPDVDDSNHDEMKGDSEGMAAAGAEEGNNENNEDEKKDISDEAYAAYRRSYCENYLKHVFNAHLDDSWFRQLYSPLARYEAAQWERQRAQAEAKAMLDEVQVWRSNPLKNITLETALSLTIDEETALRPFLPPRFHIPRAVREGCLLQVKDVPSHVTNTQLWHALPPSSGWIHHATKKEDGEKQQQSMQPDTVLQLISSIPQQTHHTRTIYWLAPNRQTCEALWQAFVALDGRAPSAPDGQQSVSWEVDCQDPYRRTEYDVDNRGGAPEDGLGVPSRKAVLTVSPYTDTTVVSVLTTALSQPSRIPEDARAATTLARALDVQQHIPEPCQLDSILEKAEQIWSQEGESKDMDPQAVRLDLTLAYLRRVHHVNFYKGCQKAEFFGDVLAGHEAASSLQCRAVVKPEDEEGADNVNATVPTGTEETSASNPIKEEEPEEGKEESAEKENAEGEDAEKSTAESAAAPAAPAKDLLVQRLDDAIQQALNVTCHEWIASADAVVDRSTDAAADELRRAEDDAEEVWLRNHSIDDEGRARCSFHFCHKLFKDQNFLRKHLKKKHYEYCKAEQAKCHDVYMMKAWERSGASRPRPRNATGPPRLIVPDILVDCGTKYGCLPAPLFHGPKKKQPQSTNNDDSDDDGYDDDEESIVVVDVVDPEPALWQKEQEQERIEKEKRQAVEEMRQRRRDESRQQRMVPVTPRKDNFVDVDDMKEEVVTMTFDQVELPQPKKKKKKRKLL